MLDSWHATYRPKRKIVHSQWLLFCILTCMLYFFFFSLYRILCMTLVVMLPLRWIKMNIGKRQWQSSKIVQSNLETGRIAIPCGRLTHSCRAQSFSRIFQVTPMYTPSNIRFIGTNRPATQNGISIESAVFSEFTVVTNGQTDRQTDQTRNYGTPSVGSNRPLTVTLMLSAMQSIKIENQQGLLLNYAWSHFDEIG